MVVSADLIKHLRQITGSSMLLCKKVLEESGGDMEKALSLLKKSSDALALKKFERLTGAGIIESYIHQGGKVGVLLELRCETDFVAKNEEFRKLAHDISLHIAGANSVYVRQEAVSEDARIEARRLFMTEAESLGKNSEMTEKIVAGKLEAYFRDVSLYSQIYVKDNTLTVEELIKRAIARFGEKIEVTRFTRYAI